MIDESLEQTSKSMPRFAPVLIEAEHFDDFGGWKLDSQFMDMMGSPFLLAHGLGMPVEDAVTVVNLPNIGRYRVWVRTRDWVATWKQPDTPKSKRAHGTPGMFHLIFDNRPLETTFGTEGADWHWQDGGLVAVASNRVELKLHDLTGFDGRCDAILLSQDLGYVPPDDAPAEWRRDLLGIAATPEDVGEFDIIVAGGGIAGLCAALRAARLGCAVALVHDRPVLGGNASSEVCVNMHGEAGFEPYPHVGDIVKEVQPDEEHHWHKGPFEAGVPLDQMRQTLADAEENLSLFMNLRLNQVEMDGDRIKALFGQNIRTGKTLKLRGRVFADCTGDACIGALAGSDYAINTSSHMGRTNLWFIEDTGGAIKFSECPWALDLRGFDFPDPSEKIDGWFWESGFRHDPILEEEYIRDWNFRAAFGAWDNLKNGKGKFPDHRIKWMAFISGKRESRRLLGDVILDSNDILDGREFEDGCVPLTWRLDIHQPDEAYTPGFEGDEFVASCDVLGREEDGHQYKPPYWMPYRCLYSRNTPNLFMAGRNISTTQNGMGATRVQRTTGMMGEIVGMAASLCKKHNTNPRGVYKNHLNDLKVLMDEPALSAGLV